MIITKPVAFVRSISRHIFNPPALLACCIRGPWSLSSEPVIMPLPEKIVSDTASHSQVRSRNVGQGVKWG